MEEVQIKCGDVEVENPISTSRKILIKISSAYLENCGSNEPFADEI